MRMLALTVAALLLIFTDYQFRETDKVRSVLTTLVAPIQYVVDTPPRLVEWLNRTTADYQELHAENQELKAQALVLQRKLQKMTALTAENIRLRELLNSTEQLDEEARLAEVIGVDPDPFTHEIVINKGSNEGVTVGQPLLDASGIMGQVISVSRFTSRVLLLTDSRHAIPVQINRNGVRAIAAGKGVTGELELLHLPDTADIVAGDLLVSSGLGGRFPPGYPVATVGEVEHDPGKPFAKIMVSPTAQLTRSRHVVLVAPRSEKIETPHVPAQEEALVSSTEILQ